jgi:hypothetical protein
LQGPVSTGVGDRLGSPLGVAGFYAFLHWFVPDASYGTEVSCLLNTRLFARALIQFRMEKFS